METADSAPVRHYYGMLPGESRHRKERGREGERNAHLVKSYRGRPDVQSGQIKKKDQAN